MMAGCQPLACCLNLHSSRLSLVAVHAAAAAVPATHLHAAQSISSSFNLQLDQSAAQSTGSSINQPATGTACRCVTAWSAAQAARMRASAACSWASYMVGQHLTRTASFLFCTVLRAALAHLAVLLPAAAACAWASCTVGEHSMNSQRRGLFMGVCLAACFFCAMRMGELHSG